MGGAVFTIGASVAIYLAILLLLAITRKAIGRLHSAHSLGSSASRGLLLVASYADRLPFTEPLRGPIRRLFRSLASLPLSRVLELACALPLPFIVQWLTDASEGLVAPVVSQALIGLAHYWVHHPRTVFLTILTWPGYRRDEIRVPLDANGINAEILECQQEQVTQVLHAINREVEPQIQAKIVDLEQLCSEQNQVSTYLPIDPREVIEEAARKCAGAFMKQLFLGGGVPDAFRINRDNTPLFIPIRFGFNGLCWKRASQRHELFKQHFSPASDLERTRAFMHECLKREHGDFGFYDWWFLQMLLFVKLLRPTRQDFENACSKLSFHHDGSFKDGDEGLWSDLRALLVLLHENGIAYKGASDMKETLLSEGGPDLMVGPADSFQSDLEQIGPEEEHPIMYSFLGQAGGFIWIECLAFFKNSLSKAVGLHSHKKLVAVLTSRAVQEAICCDRENDFYASSPYYRTEDVCRVPVNVLLRNARDEFAGYPDGATPNERRVRASDTDIFSNIGALHGQGFLLRRPRPEDLRERCWDAAYEKIRE